ncbi:MAG: cephalosporin hydroxylase family protein [Gammaproteobacteria bacterium]
MTSFQEESKRRIQGFRENAQLQSDTRAFVRSSNEAKYSYNFFWQGRPIIQYPQDIMAIQELVWAVRPDLIIETGIAHGGSLVLSASLLTLLDYYNAIETGSFLDPQAPKRKVLGVDIDIRAHNRAAIEAHPLSNCIEMIQGSSIAPEIIAQVIRIASGFERIMVLLDSNHTHKHVLAELEAYAPLVSRGSYCVVFDSVVEDLPEGFYPDRDWGPDNNPKTALHEYLRQLHDAGRNAADGAPLHFTIDKDIDDKLLITVAPDGYLRRI